MNREETYRFRILWDSFSKEWRTVLKYNIFNWFNEEVNKIVNDNYNLDNLEDEPWYNHSYQMSESELEKIKRIKYLSTVIPDSSLGGGSEYTPDLDLSILSHFSALEYLDLSCYGVYGGDWNQFLARCPMMGNIKSLRCIFNKITDLDLIVTKFPNLQELDCAYNEIENLTPLQRLNLKKLNCKDNPITYKELESFKIRKPSCTVGPLQSDICPGMDTFELNK